MEDLPKELIGLQKEQNQLLNRYLWRLRLSLLTLFVLMTVVAVVVGLGAAAIRTMNSRLPAPSVPVVGAKAYLFG